MAKHIEKKLPALVKEEGIIEPNFALTFVPVVLQPTLTNVDQGEEVTTARNGLDLEGRIRSMSERLSLAQIRGHREQQEKQHRK